HRMLGRQGQGPPPPGGPCPDEPAQPREDLAQAVCTRRGVFGHEGQRGGHQRPLVVTDIAEGGFAFPLTSVASSRYQYITRSKEAGKKSQEASSVVNRLLVV